MPNKDDKKKKKEKTDDRKSIREIVEENQRLYKEVNKLDEKYQ